MAKYMDLNGVSKEISKAEAFDFGDGGCPFEKGNYVAKINANKFKSNEDIKKTKIWVQAHTDGIEWWLPLDKDLITRASKKESFVGLTVDFEVKHAQQLNLNYPFRPSYKKTYANIDDTKKEDVAPVGANALLD